MFTTLDDPTACVKWELVGDHDTARSPLVYRRAMSDRHKSLGELVRGLRKSAGLTQSELADAIGIARSTLATIETGADLPGRETLLALADYFQISVDQLRSRPNGQRRPRQGEVVNDPDELAWLNLWRTLTHEQRIFALRLLNPTTNRR